MDSRTDLEMCLVAVSEKPFCLRLSLTETKRADGVFQSIVLHWGNPNIDLFATSLNFKVTTFFSPVPHPRARWSLSGERWTTPPLNWDRRFRFKGSTSGLAQDRRSRFANQRIWPSRWQLSSPQFQTPESMLWTQWAYLGRECSPMQSPIQISRPCSSQVNRREMQDHSYCSSLAKTSSRDSRSVPLYSGRGN
jgi:hypothetical protein